MVSLLLAAAVIASGAAQPLPSATRTCPDGQVIPSGRLCFTTPAPEKVVIVYFVGDSAILDEHARARLDELASAFLRGAAGSNLNVSGHADPHGSEAASHRLSALYAHEVYKHLVERGVPPSALTVRAFGGSRPGGSRDRRVEVSYAAGD